MEGMSRPNRQESSEQDQERVAKEYLNLNKQREAISVETTNLLKSLDSARDEQFLAGNLGENNVESSKTVYDEKREIERGIEKKMSSLFSQMTEATKEKYLKAE